MPAKATITYVIPVGEYDPSEFSDTASAQWSLGGGDTCVVETAAYFAGGFEFSDQGEVELADLEANPHVTKIVIEFERE